MDGQPIKVSIHQDYMNGSLMTSSENNAKQTINETTSAHANKPDFRKYIINVWTDKEADFTLNLRIPDWITRAATVSVNDEEPMKITDTDRFVALKRAWRNGDRITVLLPIGVKFITLPDAPDIGAFRYGADVLAGITEEERILYIDGNPEDELSMDCEREWGTFRTLYRTENQDPGINFRRLNDIGYEPYQIYFKVKKR